MRALGLVLLVGCSSATPLTAPRIGIRPQATCKITGERDGKRLFDLRYRGKPIARRGEERYTVTFTADARGATASLDTPDSIYRGFVELGDVRLMLPRRVDTGWLELDEVTIERVAGTTAVVRPTRDPSVQLAAPASFTVACDELRFGDGVGHIFADGMTPLETAEPVRLFDAPSGTHVATLITSSTCSSEVRAAYQTEESGTFRRLRIPTEFGMIHAWADAPTLYGSKYGVAFCGRSESPSHFFRDGSLICKRDVAMLVEDAGTVVEVGTLRAGARIDVLHRDGDRGEITEREHGKLTLFVRMRDIQFCRAEKPAE